MDWISLLISCSPIHQLFAQAALQDTLPDDYLPFTLHKLDNKLEGACEYLEGFTISMDLPQEYLKKELELKTLMALIKNQEITGTLAYPNGKTTKIQYKIVQHRKTDDIYMTTTLGYFLWEE